MQSDREPKRNTRAEQSERGRFARATVALFLIAVWLPLLGSVFSGERQVSEAEKRFLAPWPDLETNWTAIGRLPRELEAYLDDHIGFRSLLIQSWARITISLFGVSPSDSLLIGKQGWLFLGESDVVAQYRGLAPLSERRLDRWQRVLEQRRDWLQQRDIEFLLLLVPDKHLVYPEYMPDRLTRVGSVYPLDQLADRLTTRSDLEVVDLRGPLERAKRRERVYHKTDTHWNGAGAFAAYRAILARLRARLPALADARVVAAHEVRRITPGMGLASIVGLKAHYREQRIEMQIDAPRARVSREFRASYARREREMRPFALGVGDRSLPRAVMFRDSFANALVPYLSEHFERILYVWNRDVDPRVVNVERPDVVIQEIAGRLLTREPRGIQALLGEVPRRSPPPR